MNENFDESTRVMPVGGDSGFDRTMLATAQPSSGATQMGGTLTCAVCNTTNPGLEAYCVECGFLMSSTPGSLNGAGEVESESLELVESTSGRRFRLRGGINSVGRENCDILLLDGTVSRRHAEVTLEDGAVSVVDLGSTNGTQVDGNRLAPNESTPVRPGTVIRFGSATLTLPGIADSSPSAPAEATIVSGDFAVDDRTLVGMPDAAAERTPEAGFTPEPVSEIGAVARLVGTEGAASIPLMPGTLTVGRKPGNDVVLPDAFVSSRHAELNCDESACSITDLGSTNGTTVNGVRLEANQAQPLADGDELQIGQTSYRFETIQPAEESPESDEAPLGDEDPLSVDEDATAARVIEREHRNAVDIRS